MAGARAMTSTALTARRAYPKKRRTDDCFFRTGSGMTPETITETYGRRWPLEVAFRDAKQLPGFERSQARTPKSVKRTGPFALAACTLTVAWFAQHAYAKRVFRIRLKTQGYRKMNQRPMVKPSSKPHNRKTAG